MPTTKTKRKTRKPSSEFVFLKMYDPPQITADIFHFRIFKAYCYGLPGAVIIAFIRSVCSWKEANKIDLHEGKAWVRKEEIFQFGKRFMAESEIEVALNLVSADIETAVLANELGEIVNLYKY